MLVACASNLVVGSSASSVFAFAFVNWRLSVQFVESVSQAVLATDWRFVRDSAVGRIDRADLAHV